MKGGAKAALRARGMAGAPPRQPGSDPWGCFGFGAVPRGLDTHLEAQARPSAGPAATAEAPQGIPPLGCPQAPSSLPLHLHDQAKPGAFFFSPNYSIFILETFQGERDPGTCSSTWSVTQSQYQVLTFLVSCSGMGAGPCCPAMGDRREHLRRNVPKTGCFGYPRCPGKGQNPGGGAGLCLGSGTCSAG